jgi:hypothetical protein
MPDTGKSVRVYLPIVFNEIQGERKRERDGELELERER